MDGAVAEVVAANVNLCLHDADADNACDTYGAFEMAMVDAEAVAVIGSAKMQG